MDVLGNVRNEFQMSGIGGGAVDVCGHAGNGFPARDGLDEARAVCRLKPGIEAERVATATRAASQRAVWLVDSRAGGGRHSPVAALRSGSHPRLMDETGAGTRHFSQIFPHG